MEEKTSNLDKENTDPIFTGSRYVDIEILAQIDNLGVVCGLNDYISELCESDDLWKRKLELRYGKDILIFVKNNFKLKYNLLPIDNMRAICSPHTYADPNSDTYLDIHLDIFEWIYYKNGTLPSTYEKREAASSGQIEILKWLEKIGVLPDQDTANFAADGGHLNILEWLGEKGIFPDQEGSNCAAVNNHINVLEWIELRSTLEHGITEKDPILPDQNAVNYTAKMGHLNVLKWVFKKNKILPDQEGVKCAAMGGHLKILKWVYKKNSILPCQDIVNYTAENHHFNILKWVYRKNKVLPNQEGVFTLNLIRRKNYMFPDQEWSDDLEILKWRYKKDKILPASDLAIFSPNRGSLEFLKWVYKENCILSANCDEENNLAEKECWKILKFSKDKGISLDNE